MGKHSEWRKLAKKFRRKRIRQRNAQTRDRNAAEDISRFQKSPSYQILLEEQVKRENQRILEEKKLHEQKEKEWLKIEEIAQQQFKELQKKLALAKEERAKQNEKIKVQWEEEQKKIAEINKQKEDELNEKLRQEELLKSKVEDFIEFGGDTPEHLKTNLETNPNKELCPFFQKTATCRFFDACSRNHIRPSISKILLVPNFFVHYSLEKTENDHITDSNLEFENYETHDSYREFYKDVVPEIENFGRIRLFITCCNRESHLRGNVFVEFYKTRAALKCYRGLNGRWYAGKQLSVQFVNIQNWNSAVCGVYYINRCPKGNSCNFLHTFRNPGNSYSVYENTRRNVENRKRHHTESRNWRWSESPESSPEEEKEWEVDSRSVHNSTRNGDRRKRESKERERKRTNRYKKKELSKRKR